MVYCYIDPLPSHPPSLNYGLLLHQALPPCPPSLNYGLLLHQALALALLLCQLWFIVASGPCPCPLTLSIMVYCCIRPLPLLSLSLSLNYGLLLHPQALALSLSLSKLWFVVACCPLPQGTTRLLGWWNQLTFFVSSLVKPGTRSQFFVCAQYYIMMCRPACVLHVTSSTLNKTPWTYLLLVNPNKSVRFKYVTSVEY